MREGIRRYEYDTAVESGRAGGSVVAVRVLAIVAALLALVLIVGTAIALVSGSREKKLEREAAFTVKAEGRGRTAFTGIGTIRARSADPDGAVVIAAIAVPYDASDIAFTEELKKKTPVLRAAAVQILQSQPAERLAPAYEAGIKAALRDAFNARLSLGKVDEIWLSDFVVVR
jgi:flagellar basal body-associated protein FliL